jgi:multidrug resistance efflux pump
VSRIYDALTIAEDQVVERFTLAPGAQEEPFAAQGSRRVSLPLDISPVWNKEPQQGGVPQLPGKVEVSRSKVRSLLLLGFLTIGGVLVGTNYALRPNSANFVGLKDPFGVNFEGKLRPATEIRITSASMGTVSEIYVKVGDTVKAGQQMVRLDDMETRMSLQQASAEREMAQQNLDHFRSRLADANARVAIAQRKVAQVPVRQLRDSPQRAQASFDQATVNYNRAKQLFGLGVIAQQELDARATDLRIAQDDLENAKKLASVSATLEDDQSEQAGLEARVTRQDLIEQLRQSDLKYQQAKQRVSESVVTATQDGVVSEIPVKIGDRVPTGTVVTQLAELKRMVADVPVAATMISKLEVGETVSIKLPSTPPTEVQGVIHTINPLPSANMTHNVEVQFDNPTMLLLAGQPAEVRFQRP